MDQKVLNAGNNLQRGIAQLKKEIQDTKNAIRVNDYTEVCICGPNNRLLNIRAEDSKPMPSSLPDGYDSVQDRYYQYVDPLGQSILEKHLESLEAMLKTLEAEFAAL